MSLTATALLTISLSGTAIHLGTSAVAGNFNCLATGTYSAATMNVDQLETVGPCNAMSGQSAF